MKQLLLLIVFVLGMLSPLLGQEAKDGPTVLITGANRGLGLEFAKQFSEKGYKVIGTARSPEKAEDLKATGAEIVKLDVTSKEDIAALAESLKGRKIDILLNNAAYFGPTMMWEEGISNFETIEAKEMEDCFRINTLGPLFVSQALLPNLKLSEIPKIINISSGFGTISYGQNVAWGYGVSKSALNRVVTNMHAALHKDGFIVIALGPGHNKTDMGGKEEAKLQPEESIAKMIPLIEGLTEKESGKFFFYTGKELSW
ncbi:MAG: SDR family oxidoreductase [Roseibacillus sp.]